MSITLTEEEIQVIRPKVRTTVAGDPTFDGEDDGPGAGDELFDDHDR